jgi:5-methyltetrahydropteroyltriglutamate--homocysteine methyltransferase
MPSPPRIPTTHVGSLIRPPELVELLTRERDGAVVDPDERRRVLDRAVHDLVARQVEVGIDIVSDGEFGKTWSWSQYVLTRLGGFELRPASVTGTSTAISGKDRRDFAEFYAEYEGQLGVAGLGKGAVPPGTWVVTGPITYTGAEAVRADAARLRAAMAVAGATAGFLPVVAPASDATEEAALFAIADAMNEEYRAVIDAGLDVQIDDAYLATTYDVMVPPGSLEDYRRWAALRVEALNWALRGVPPERSRYHVCWGSWNGPHSNDVALRDVVDLILRVDVGAYSLEMANPRHEHEWRVWEDVALPEGKRLLPGLVSHSTNVVEHPELVAERIVRLARLVGPDRVVASTDCGFAQGPFTRRVHPSIMWAKLASVVEGARLAATELWGPIA